MGYGYNFKGGKFVKTVEAIQKSTKHIYLYKEADKIHGCNLKTTKCMTAYRGMRDN